MHIWKCSQPLHPWTLELLVRQAQCESGHLETMHVVPQTLQAEVAPSQALNSECIGCPDHHILEFGSERVEHNDIE